MSQYLQKVLDGKLPHSHEIMFNMQKMVNLLPNLGVDSLVKSMFIETNDSHLVRAQTVNHTHVLGPLTPCTPSHPLASPCPVAGAVHCVDDPVGDRAARPRAQQD
jgi:hypothetical protein